MSLRSPRRPGGRLWLTSDAGSVRQRRRFREGASQEDTQVSTQENPTPEEIEGIGDEDADWGNYPIDTLLIRNEQRTVYDVVRRIRQGQFIMNPDFQRAFIWNDEKQSKLIESVLMRIPLPVFYLAEDAKGRMIVVDGLQRLSTFDRFIRDELKLKLPNQPALFGKCFHDLSPKLQNRVEDCNLVLYIVDAKIHERARLDIFDRVNSGVPLTRQQMRNSLYMGQATSFLRKESQTDLFKRATGHSLRPDTMRDREFVNRFCAFHLLALEDYKGEMDDFLARVLIQMNLLPKENVVTLSDEFNNSLRNNLSVFGEHAFRKHSLGQDRRSVLNASLWDVMSSGLSRVPAGLVRSRATELRSRFYDVMEDARFVRSITYGTNSTNAVQHRFQVMKLELATVFSA